MSYMGWLFGICYFGWGLSNMGGFCHRFVVYGLVLWGLSFLLGFVEYGQVLSRGLLYMGWFFGVCHIGWGLSNIGGFCHGVCHIWVGSLGFVTLFGVCQVWAGFATGFVVIFMRHKWAVQRVLPRPLLVDNIEKG